MRYYSDVTKQIYESEKELNQAEFKTAARIKRKGTSNMKKTANLQDIFLTKARKQGVPLTVFLVVCLISMGVMFGMVKWLERVTK